MGNRRRSRSKPTTGLASLANVGPATLRDFEALNIHTVEALAAQDPDALYRRLSCIMGGRLDPCVWDVFRAAIHEAQTGEKTTWWSWTPERKKRQAQGAF